MTATIDTPTGYEPLDPAIREQYDRDGFVVIKKALDEESRAYFEGAVDRIPRSSRRSGTGTRTGTGRTRTSTWTCGRCS